MVAPDIIRSKLAPLLQETGVTAMAAILEMVISHSALIQDQDHTALDQALDHTALDPAQDHTALDLAQDHTALDQALDHTGLDPVIAIMEVLYRLEDLATQTLVW